MSTYVDGASIQPERLSGLGTGDIQFYHDQGYLEFRSPVFSEREFNRLNEIFEEDLEKYGADGLDTIHFRDPRLLDFLMSEAVLRLVRPLIGPNIGLWSSHFICKPALTGKATPWHEDSSYWQGRLDRMSDIVTVWLAIDRAFPENGSMGVIPGTHHNGFSQYQEADLESNIFGSQIVGVDESQAVYFNLDANQCSLHDARIIHGAKANSSLYRRCGYTMRYFPTQHRVNRDDPRNNGFKIWLASGRDIAGNLYEN